MNIYDYDLNYAKERQTAVMKEVMTDQWLREYRIGHPSMAQRTIVAVGEAMEATGGWLKARGNTNSGHATMNRGLAVSR